jgi:hypothetical protein
VRSPRGPRPSRKPRASAGDLRASRSAAKTAYWAQRRSSRLYQQGGIVPDRRQQQKAQQAEQAYEEAIYKAMGTSSYMGPTPLSTNTFAGTTLDSPGPDDPRVSQITDPLGATQGFVPPPPV